MKIFIGTFLAFLAITSPVLLACTQDYECSPGAACIKEPGSINGYCSSGSERSVTNPLDDSGKCMSDADCGPGGSCQVTRGISGTCV